MTEPAPDPSFGIARWVDIAPPAEREFRQAIHLILAAIESDAELRGDMIMKGGILMALRYRSPRFTRDIDFSTPHTLKEIDPADFERRFSAALALQVAESEYDLDCRVQSCKVLPANRPAASFPSIKLTIGHAAKGTPKHRRLLAGESPHVISIDYSTNECILSEETLVTDGGSIRVYAFTDLVAEKLRSLLQQEKRNRYRRQDIYDLNLLLTDFSTVADHAAILESLLAKSRSRGIHPSPDSLSNPEIRRRAEAEYGTLADEIEGELPAFAAAYDKIEHFYRSLPWE